MVQHLCLLTEGFLTSRQSFWRLGFSTYRNLDLNLRYFGPSLLHLQVIKIENRTGKTKWRWMQSAANRSLGQIPINSENYSEFSQDEDRLWFAAPNDGCKRATTLVRTPAAGTSTSRAEWLVCQL